MGSGFGSALGTSSAGGALTGAVLTGGALTGGAVCVECEPSGIASVGPLDSGRRTSSVANRVAKKAVNNPTTSIGVSIFWADTGRARLLESGVRFLDMGNG